MFTGSWKSSIIFDNPISFQVMNFSINALIVYFDADRYYQLFSNVVYFSPNQFYSYSIFSSSSVQFQLPQLQNILQKFMEEKFSFSKIF